MKNRLKLFSAILLIAATVLSLAACEVESSDSDIAGITGVTGDNPNDIV